MASRYSIPLHERFVPVPVRARADGWTVERQRGFVLALSQGLTIGAAAGRVGMSARSAYRLHDRPHAGSFRRAWRAAQSLGEPEWEPPRPVRWIVVKRYAGRIVHREERWNEVAVRRVITHHDPYAFSRRTDTTEQLALGRRAIAEVRARCLATVRARSREVLQPRCGCNEAVREVCDLSDVTAGRRNSAAQVARRPAASGSARSPPPAQPELVEGRVGLGANLKGEKTLRQPRIRSGSERVWKNGLRVMEEGANPNSPSPTPP